MRFATAVSMFLLILTSSVEAAFTDFSEFTQSKEFAVGETFTSQGITFRAVDFASSSTPVPVRIIAQNSYAYVNPGPGLEFVLPPSIREVSLTYGNSGVNIAINGVEPLLYPASYPGEPGRLPFQLSQGGLDFLNGTTLGGVSITARRLIPPPMGNGYLKLSGPIHSLIIAGVELDIDNITVRVPEPSTAVIFLASLFSALLRRPITQK